MAPPPLNACFPFSDFRHQPQQQKTVFSALALTKTGSASNVTIAYRSPTRGQVNSHFQIYKSIDVRIFHTCHNKRPHCWTEWSALGLFDPLAVSTFLCSLHCFCIIPRRYSSSPTSFSSSSSPSCEQLEGPNKDKQVQIGNGRHFMVPNTMNLQLL